MSPRSLRRWRTCSPATSPRIPPTGTCCSRSGSPICARRARAAFGGQDRSDSGQSAGDRVLMRIGMVCPYSFDVPGGVQAHVLQLAEVMRAVGTTSACWRHRRRTSICPTTSSPAARPSRSRTTARWPGCASGPPLIRKVKKWLADGDFDVLHLHEPNAPSLSMLALQAAEGPDRRDLPHLDDEIVDAQRLSGHPAAVSREDRGPHRGVGSGPALADGGVGLRRRGDPQRGRCRIVRRRLSPRRATREPASRCCSWAATTNHAKGWRCCWRRCPHSSNGSPMSRY